MILSGSLTQLSNPPRTESSLPRAFLLWNGAATSQHPTQTSSLNSQLANLNPINPKQIESEDNTGQIDRVLKQTQHAKQTQLNAESSRIQIQTSKTLMDLVVTEQKSLSKSENFALLKQLTSLSHSPSNTQHQVIESFKQILSKQTAHLVKLSLGEKSQWALSDKPIAIGEKVNVNINAPKVWQAEPQPARQKAQAAITAQTIRESLPNAKEISSVLRILENILKQPAVNSNQTVNTKTDLPSSVQEALARLKTFVSKPEHLTKPEFLKEAIKNSGGFYETKHKEHFKNSIQINRGVSQTVSTPASKNEKPSKAIDSFILSLLKRRSNEPRSKSVKFQNQRSFKPHASDKLFITKNKFYNIEKTPVRQTTNSNNFLLKTDGLINNVEPRNSGNKLSETVANSKTSPIQQLKFIPNTDFKAQLLILKQLTDTFLKPKELVQPKPIDAKSTPNAADKNNIDQTKTLNGILHSAENSTTKKNNTAPTNRSVINQIQQLALSALAKIQLQQAQSLLHTNTQFQEGKPPGILLQLELPVQIDQQIYSINLKIEQDWIDAFAKKNKCNSENNKVKRWQVNLNFDLPKLGQLFARITQIEESTRVQFWAEEIETLVKAKNKLSELKKQLQEKGVFVEEISCEVGIPNNQNTTQLNCALVDVCT